jgi:hypothetical protein
MSQAAWKMAVEDGSIGALAINEKLGPFSVGSAQLDTAEAEHGYRRSQQPGRRFASGAPPEKGQPFNDRAKAPRETLDR